MMIDFRHQSTKTTIISGYKPFYIQRPGESHALDTREQWGLVAKTNPYPLLPTPKEPYANDWKDEDGLDEYNAKMYYEPIEFSVSFYVKAYESGGQTAAEVLRGWLGNFFDYIREGEFCTFDSYTAVGFRKVRFDGYDEDSFRARGDWAAATVTVKFKANDPTTKMYFANRDDILPQWSGQSITAASTPNKTVQVTQSGFVLAAGVRLAVDFRYANTASAPALKIGSGTAYPIIHAPASGLQASTYYFFEFTGTVWDCLGTL